ncbi:hypothetical protein QYE76_011895 [Lolium multiflorum]|uniref:Retrotransposon gag domain-containing protein n=1 Tax=Lolium multiflorum TaxID=4521 RepID=A0AAD8TZS0_LOLMU|nr:hypothetical protein QYE76_011895 [Lolium multiflorum]
MSGAPSEESEEQRLEREAKQKAEADEAARNQFPPPPPPMTQQNFLQYMQMLEERQRVTMEQQNKFFQELLQQNRVERPENQGVTLSDFQNTKPISFAYAPEPMDAEDWLMDTERKLNTVGCNDLEKVRYATHLLCGPAASWWDNIVAVYPADKVFTWDEFKRKFRESNVPESIVELKRREFESLEQKDKAILTYVREFSGLSRNPSKEIFSELDEINAQGPIFARSFQKTERIMKWGDEAPPRGPRGQGWPAPCVGPSCRPLTYPFAYLKPPSRNHREPRYGKPSRDAAAANPISGDSGDRLRHPAGEGIHLPEDSRPPWSPPE